MGRKSKLNTEQWAQIERRLLEGESRRALGREFGISEASIRERMATPVEEVRDVAEKIIAAEVALAALPPISRVSAQNLASKLRSISDSLASAAEYGAKTAHRLNALANSEVGKVDDANPLGSMEALRGVSALTKLANDSASIAVSLLQANKETVKQINDEAGAEQRAAAEMRPKLSREEWEKKHGLGVA
jgi:hypothetical protein